MLHLPKINSLLYVSAGEAEAYRTRLEDVQTDLLTVGAPLGVGGPVPPADGSDLEIFWIEARARYVLPVRMIGHTRAPSASWYLLAIDEPVRQSRRRYVRGGGGEPITVVAAARYPAVTLRGRVIDLGEGGVRCLLPGFDLFPGELVTVRLTLPEREVQVSGTVLFARHSHEAVGLDLVVQYEAPEPEAQVIRRHVFAWEVDERRKQLEQAGVALAD